MCVAWLCLNEYGFTLFLTPACSASSLSSFLAALYSKASP